MTEQAVAKKDLSNLDEQQVVEYLQAHPDFFVTHDYLLRDLKVPHQSGAAISLGERQVQVFREHRDDLKKQLHELIGIARANDEHFEKSKRLLLNLLEIKSLDEVDFVVKEAFKNDSNIDFSSVVIFGERTDYPVTDIPIINTNTAREQLGALIESTNAICGHFTEKQLACLFPADHASVGSAAVIPLRQDTTIGMFCLASKDTGHFDSSMGSLFLSYISDFISRILPDLLARARSQKINKEVPSLLE